MILTLQWKKERVYQGRILVSLREKLYGLFLIFLFFENSKKKKKRKKERKKERKRKKREKSRDSITEYIEL